uniref:Uncharacterized protein n=1 Tax=Ditylenchus dipsaci TaxID=166011 RepID=A0A915DZN6_9BILA
MVGQTGSHVNVDFAYTGPPVVVSNGQALDLVCQFGVQNAWYAYLKLRGMNLSKEEAEKAVALKKFRNKIRRLKKAAENLKDRHEDFDLFLNKEFSTFLEPNSLEIGRMRAAHQRKVTKKKTPRCWAKTAEKCRLHQPPCLVYKLFKQLLPL